MDKLQRLCDFMLIRFLFRFVPLSLYILYFNKFDIFFRSLRLWIMQNLCYFALETSKQALPIVYPIRLLGVSLFTNGHVIATGFTYEVGSHHAEIDALSKIQGHF